MSLKAKAAAASRALAGIDDLEPPASPSPSGDVTAVLAEPSARPLGRARSGVASITETITQHHKLADLQKKVEDYELSGVVVQLDPSSVSPGTFKNRHELSYATADFEALRSDIAQIGSNVQPILVRPCLAPGTPYEVVYGRRRLRACLELGLRVRAIVKVMDAAEAFQAMERENRARANLSAWEQGAMYKDALDQGLFPSLRQMAAALDVDPTNLSRAVRLASLPLDLIEAFPSPLDVQYRWIVPLCDAYDRDASKVLSEAAALKAASPRLRAKDALARLTASAGKADASEPLRREFRLRGKPAASWSKDRKGNVAVSIKAGSMSDASEKKLLGALERMFQEE
jgi:ParB family chromosome partitioning protein